MVLAAEAGAVYKVGNSALINTDIFEMYLEKFKEPTRPLPKHIWNKLLGEDKKTTIVPVLIKRPVIVTFGIIETNVIYGHSKKNLG